MITLAQFILIPATWLGTYWGFNFVAAFLVNQVTRSWDAYAECSTYECHEAIKWSLTQGIVIPICLIVVCLAVAAAEAAAILYYL